jgi:chromosome segregation ATPase
VELESRKDAAMASIDEVISSISANAEAVNELQAQVEGSKAMAEETLGQLQSLSVEGAAAALGACKDQLEECSAIAAALQNKLNEAMTTAVAAKQS